MLKKNISFIFICALIASVLATGVFSVQAAEQKWPEVPQIDGEAIVLMEAETSAMLYEYNSDVKMYPASTTKILTAIIVLENCDLSETVTFSENACYLEDGAVTIDSIPGEEMPLKDVLYGLLLPSGNDCACALAEHVAGSVEAFAEMMNEKAKEIGAVSSHFANPSGLFNSDHYTTAADMALIAQYAFQNSAFVEIISTSSYTIGPTNKTPESRIIKNSHEMIIPGSDTYNSDVIGGKTGYLYESGRCLVTYAKKNGITLLSVILDGDYYGIFTETQELLDYGFSNFTIANVSESESLFSYGDELSPVQLDPQSQIVTLNAVRFEDLECTVTFAYDLNSDEYADAKEAAGIYAGDTRSLFAMLDYYYDQHYLGRCNVFINPQMNFSQASFIQLSTVNVWMIILLIILLGVASLYIIHLAKKNISRNKRHRKTIDATDLYKGSTINYNSAAFHSVYINDNARRAAQAAHAASRASAARKAAREHERNK